MSVKNVKAFFAKLEGDKVLQTKVGALKERAKKDVNDAVAELVKIASAAGCAFTADDYAKARTRKAKAAEVFGQHQPELPQDCPDNWACTRVNNM